MQVKRGGREGGGERRVEGKEVVEPSKEVGRVLGSLNLQDMLETRFRENLYSRERAAVACF
jgi:hypothetical protein